MRFTGMGRDRKYEIRNTESKPMLNAERPVQKEEGRYNVPGTKYKVGIRICIRILRLQGSCFPQAGYLVLGTFLASCYLILVT